MRLPMSVLAAALATAACGGSLEEPAFAEFQTGTAALEDAAGSGVRFLPPLARGAGGSKRGAVRDAHRHRRIVAEDGSTVATFDRGDLHRDRGSRAFHVNWNTRRSDLGTFTIVVSSPGGDIGSIEIELVSGPARRNNHHGHDHDSHLRRAGATLPIRFRVQEAALDRDGDGVRDWLDACPDLAGEDPLDADCDGAPDGQEGAGGSGGSGGFDGETDEPGEGGTSGVPGPSAVRITVPGEAYGHHGDCTGWNACGDAATCALFACIVNGYSDLVSYGASAPCTDWDACHLLDGVSSVQMDWGDAETTCAVMAVSEIDCAP